MAASAENVPSDTGARSFSTTFRGFDPAEVRAYLAKVEQQRQALRDELDALRARTSGAPVLDEGTAAELLGEEAARLLTTAREGAGQIRAKAEENATRLLSEAQDAAARTRADADIEVARRLNDASEQAAAEIEEAKRQGRELVFEAQALRTKMLEDVARRRQTARAQLEALRAGREELLAALDRAQDALGKVSTDVRAAAPELLEPPDASADAGAALVDIEAGGAGTTFPVASTTPTVPSSVERTGLSLVLPLAGEKNEPTAERPAFVPDRTPHRIDVSSLVEGPDRHDAVDEAADGPAPETTEPSAVAERHGVNVEADVEAAGAEADTAEAVHTTADDLFARIRADRERAVAGAREVLARDDAGAPADADDEPPRPVAAGPDVDFLSQRAEVLGPLESTLTHSLKRALADEQNHALDHLRRASDVATVEALVGSLKVQLERFTAAAQPQLRAALVAGVQSAGGDEGAGAGAEAELFAAVATDLVAPLRERIERAVSNAGGANDELPSLLRAAYREWKLQRLDSVATQLTLVAHGRGTALGLRAGTPVRWVVDPSGPACPDADDNALAGAVPCGEAFPTGHTHAPAHPGCRCGLVRDESPSCAPAPEGSTPR